jgi:hypothetical protein
LKSSLNNFILRKESSEYDIAQKVLERYISIHNPEEARKISFDILNDPEKMENLVGSLH